MRHFSTRYLVEKHLFAIKIFQKNITYLYYFSLQEGSYFEKISNKLHLKSFVRINRCEHVLFDIAKISMPPAFVLEQDLLPATLLI